MTMLTDLFSSRNVNRPHKTIALPMQVKPAISHAAWRNVGFVNKSTLDETPGGDEKEESVRIIAQTSKQTISFRSANLNTKLRSGHGAVVELFENNVL